PQPFPTEKLYDLMIHGYAVFPSFVSKELCFNAIKYINYHIGKPAEGSVKNNITPHLISHMLSDPEVMDLYYASASSTIYTLFGSSAGEVKYDVLRTLTCQVALRFPEMDHQFPVVSESQPGPPLGGVQWHTDGMDKGDYAPFTILIGVALSDQMLPYSGNLCVFPGSHYSLQDFVRQFVARSQPSDDTRDPTMLLNRPVLEEPVQILAKTGDVVILHQKLAHRGGPNYNCDIRRMVYFRISHKKHDELKGGSVENIWLEFEGMSEVL
ncbi:unnamed protein product, partial [Ectocarpus fasciculatus]